MAEVGGENPGIQAPKSDVVKPKEARNGQAVVVQSFLRASGFMNEFPADRLTPQQLAARDLIAEATTQTIDSKKRQVRNKFDSLDGLKVYDQKEGIPVDDLISFLQARIQSGELDAKDKQTYKKLGKVLLRNSVSYYDAHDKGTARRFARIRQEEERVRSDPRLRTGDAYGDYIKAQELLNQRRELVIPPKDKQPTVAADTQNADFSPVIPPETPPPILDGATPSEAIEPPIVEATKTTAGPDATSAEAWSPSLFDEPIEATWKNKDTDAPIKITGYMGKGPDGRYYFSIEEGTTGVPLDEIDASPDVLDALKAKIPFVEPEATEEAPETPAGRKAVWKNGDTDVPVVITGSLGNDDDGQERFAAEGHPEGIPVNQLEFAPGEPKEPATEPETAPEEPKPKIDEEEKDSAKDKTAKTDDEKDESTTSTKKAEASSSTSAEDVIHEVLMDNGLLIIRKAAALDAMKLVRQELQKGSAINPFNWGRKVGLRLLEPYWRQRIARQIVTVANAGENPHATIDTTTSSIRFLDLFRGQVRQLNIDIENSRAAGTQTEAAEIKKVLDYGVRGPERVREAKDTPEEFRKAVMDDVIKPLVNRDGVLTDADRAQLQKQIRDVVEKNMGNVTIQDFFGRKATEYNINADYFATNILETINMVKEDLAAHRYGLEALDKVVQIRLANTRWGTQDEAHFNRVDKAIAAMQGTRLGILSNPAFVGAVTSIGIYGTMKALGYAAQAGSIVPGTGMFTGAIFAALRRNYDIKVDMSMQRNEKTEGAKIPETGAKRRKKLEEFAYNTVSVSDWINGGAAKEGEDTRGINQLVNLDLTNGINRSTLIQKVADGDARLDFSLSNKVDLFTFDSRLEISQGKLSIEEALANAKRKLREAGVTDAEMSTAKGNRETRFAADIETQDKRFANYRLRQAALAGAFGATAGLASGLLVKEGISLVQGHGIDWQPFNLAREGLEKITDFKNMFQHGGSTQVDNYTVTAGADHSLSIVDKSGNTVIKDGLSLNSDGHITAENTSPDVIKHFKDAGFTEPKPGGDTIQKTIFDSTQATELKTVMGHDTVIPKGTEWVPDSNGKADLVLSSNRSKILINDIDFSDGKTSYDRAGSIIKDFNPEGGVKQVIGPDGVWDKNGTAITREWYGNNTPKSDLNELRQYNSVFTTSDGQKGVVWDMSRMEQSFQAGNHPPSVDVQGVIQKQEAVFAFSTPEGKTILVSDMSDGKADGKFTLDPTDFTHRIDPKNPNSMTVGEFSKIVLNQDALKKLPNGELASELYNHRDVFNLGQNGKPGFIEAGHLNGKTLQVFATSQGTGPTPTTIGGPISFNVNAPITDAFHATELIPPSGREIPIIPFPFAPRWPLEDLVPGIGVPEAPPVFYYGGENVTEAREWIKTHPQAHKPYTKRKDAEGNDVWFDAEGNPIVRDVAKEREEIEVYLKNIETTEPSHNQLTHELAAKLPPMKDKTRVAVNVPAWLEGKNIYGLLDEYTKQVDKNGNELDPDLYEINIIVNRKTGTPSDNSVAEIERFKAETQAKGKNYNINYVDVEFDAPFNNVGNARRVITDTTLVRSLARPTQAGQLYIESEDADLLRVDPHTVSNLIDKLDSSPHLDAVRGIQDRLPETMMTNDYLFLYRRAQDFKEMLLRRGAYRPEKNQAANYTWNRVITGGWNTGYTAQAYAMIGGYNPYQTKGEDMIMGERFSMARGDGTTPNTEVIGKVATRSDSSPRRYIWETASGKAAYGPDFEDENVNRELRDKTPEELMARISHLSRIDNANTTTFQSMLNSEHQFVRATTPNEMDAQKVTRAILGYLGLKREDYGFGSNGNLEIRKWDNVRDALNSYRARHVAPRGPGERVGNRTTATPPTEDTTPRSVAESPIPIMKESIKVSGLKLNPIPLDTGTDNIVDYSGRKIVLVDINGVQVPFYLSTGLGGKANVASGKWYPFFGIGDDGWINKTSEEDMNTYYGSDALRKAAETLDTTVGDIRSDQSIPKVSNMGAHIETINAGLTPKTRGEEKTEILQKSIQGVLAKIDAAPAESVASAPTIDANELQAVRDRLAAERTTSISAHTVDVLDPNDKWEADSIESGGTPNPSALQIENIVDGQECITPSGMRGKVIDHVTLPDGSQGLRIKIIDGKIKDMWGIFDQEDLNNGKISTWITADDN